MNYIITALCLMVVYTSLDYERSHISVSTNGEPNGVLSKVTATILGRYYWETQADLISEKISELESEPAKDAAIEKELEDMDKQFNIEDELFYKENPSMRPSKAQREADSLREKADEIEYNELMDYLDSIRLEKLKELRGVYIKVSRKLKNS